MIDTMCDRLKQAIEIYEKTPLGKVNASQRDQNRLCSLLANVSGQVVEIDPEARKALNFIETGFY